MKTLKKITALVLTALAVLCVSCSSNKIRDIEVELPDLTNKTDGTYHGEHSISGTPVKVALDVVLRNRVLTSINITRHACSPIGKKAEGIIEVILEHQSLDVDVVSGATASSKAILKAVESALKAET